MPLRCIAFAFFACLLSASFIKPAIAQQPQSNAAPADLDKTDARVFAELFRRDIRYANLAASATTPDDPKSRLVSSLASTFHLDSVQAASLDRISHKWAEEVDPLRSQMLKAINAFHRSFPNGRLSPGIDPTVPQPIRDMRHQIDQITLHYRDKLRNDLSDATFLPLQNQLRNHETDVTPLPATPPGPNGGAQ